MANNVYGAIAQIAATFRASDVPVATGSGGRAEQRARDSPGARPGASGKSGAGDSGADHGRNAHNRRQPASEPYRNTVKPPDIKFIELADHSIRIEVGLTSAYAGSMTAADLAQLRHDAGYMEREMRRLSRGRLSYERLEEMNHPYRHGPFAPRRRSGALSPQRARILDVVSMEVINRHTGNLEQAWDSDAVLGGTGAVLMISNSATYSAALMKGTSTMKAHGPFYSVPRAMKGQLMNRWKDMERRAFHREQAERGQGG